MKIKKVPCSQIIREIDSVANRFLSCIAARYTTAYKIKKSYNERNMLPY